MKKREEIVEKMCECIFKDRQNTYGKPEECFQTVADFWNTYLKINDDCFKITKQDVANMMLLLKVARMSASPEHKDNYIDAAGYAVIAGSFCNDKK